MFSPPLPWPLRLAKPEASGRPVLLLASLIVAVYVFDHQLTQTLPLLGFYWLPVLMATSFASVRQVAVLNGLALLLAVASGLQLGFLAKLPGEYGLRLLAVAAIGLASLQITHSRVRQERRLIAANSQLQRQIGFYRVLSRCARAIETSADRTELLQAVCEQAVSTGDLTMAWAGLLDPDTAAIQPVAQAGEGRSYLEDIQISADPLSPYGQGPTGQCVRSGEPFWCQDFCSHPATAAWHQRAQRSGLGASASIPLRCGGAVVGAINLYAPSPGAFSDDIQALLLDMVVAVDLALERFRRQEQQQRAQEALQQSEHNYRQLTETIHDVIWRLDAATLTTTYVSPAVRHLLGYSPAELQGQPFKVTLHSDSYGWLSSLAPATAEGSDGFRVDELQQRHRDGSTIWCELTSSLARNSLTGALELYGVSRDITARKQAESQLEWLAYYDRLTTLPNRTLIHNLLDQALRTARRADQPVALLALGLDHFKAINDAIGYDTGDAVLLEISRRLRRHLRDNDLVGRGGNDEFVLVLPGANAGETAQLCERLQELVREPIGPNGQALRITCSIGVALFPTDGNDSDTLMRKATIAMAQAKRDGRDRLRFSTAALEQQVRRQVELTHALYGALSREELRLQYQPQLDLRTGELVGAEVLLRWHHHRLGSVSPEEFIPIAESSGLILPIGEWVLQQAIQQLQRWQQQGLEVPLIAVNLSAVQLRQHDLAERVLAALAQARLEPARLELELTESVLIDDPEASIAAMDRFSLAGIQLAIDDFGTGYSSLSYLKRLRVQKLKIDGSFIRDLGNSEHDSSIVQAIINLAQGLGMRTIAEGVENERQLTLLRQMGCDQIQGYHYAKPLSPEALFSFAGGLPSS